MNRFQSNLRKAPWALWYDRIQPRSVKMKILFSVDVTDIQADLDGMYPSMGTEQGVKSFLFLKFQQASVTPVRFLVYNQSGNDCDLLVDVPAVNALNEIASDVLPYTAAAV
jgi:hypothetical protein